MTSFCHSVLPSMSSRVSESSILCENCRSSIAGLNATRSSPAPHLLSSNCPPLEGVARSVRAALVEAKSSQALLTHEIARLQATIDELCNQKQSVDKYIREHEAILSPTRKILPEILSEIFLWCFADGALGSTADAPVVLGQVCSYWRSVANSTPRLWSSLVLRINQGNIKSKAELASTALSRSGACLLDIECIIDDLAGSLDYVDPCLYTLLYHSHRWRSFRFRLSPSWFQPISQKFSCLKGAMPILERLELYGLPP